MRLTVPLFKWASPRSLRLLKVKVPKSNSVVAVIVITLMKKSVMSTMVKESSDIEELWEKGC